MGSPKHQEVPQAACGHTDAVHHPPDREEIQRRKLRVKETLRCPHCNEKLSKWLVPDTPFIEWSSEFQYICFNDACAYFADGWATLASQGSPCSYRFMFDPPTGGCYSIPVPTAEALRDGIVEGE